VRDPAIKGALWQADFLVVCIFFFNGELGTVIDFYSFAD